MDDAFAYELLDQTVLVNVTYRDAGCSGFQIEYDNADPQAGLHEGAFRPADGIAIDGTSHWKTAKFTLPQCRFMNRCNGADFRISGFGGDFPDFAYGGAFAVADINVHEFVGTVGTDDKSIDVLVVSLQDSGGHISRRGDPGSNGVRDWIWDTLGQSGVGGAGSYGSPNIYKKAIDY